MTEIKLYDYWDEWGWMYFGIGMGNLSASVIVPLIEAAKDDEITVRINSGGGACFDGWAIYNALKSHQKKVIIQIDGIAASIASIIAMAGDEIVCMKGSMMMIHKPTTPVWMYDSMDADELKKEAEALDKVQSVLNSIYVLKTGLDAAAIDNMINEETWLTPSEALALNFITSINEGTTVSAGIPQNAFNHIFNSAPAKVRAYANQHIPIIKTNDMNKETKSILDEAKQILNNVKKKFGNLFKVENSESTTADGTTFYYEGDLAEGTAVFSDVELTTALADGDYELEDGRTMTVADGSVSSIADAAEEEDPENSAEVEALQNQITEKDDEIAQLTNALKEANNALNKVRTIKTNTVPKERKQDFNKSGATPAGEENSNKKFIKPSKNK